MRRFMPRPAAVHGLAALLLLPLLMTSQADAQQIPENVLNGISYREIGPTAQGGRFVDFAVPLQQPSTFYAATASGGLWKTVNNGHSFTSLLDDTEIISLGAVAVAPSDPDVVYIGTGEGNNSRSVYFGDGIYKSADAGETWTHVGLPESHHIGRILVHPRDPDVVYVAALGHLYSDNPDRGLYKTTNGGRSWSKVLSVRSEGRDIGVVDVAMDPRDPDVLYAAAYDKVRRPWTFNEGGPGSGIYKTTNGGRSWTQLTDGLPSGMLGRIGIAVSPQGRNLVYAVIENANVEGLSDQERRQQLLEGRPPERGTRVYGNQIYRSTNGGRSWEMMSDESGAIGGSPPYYYGQLRVDPNDREHLYNLGVGVTHSTDGGATWERAWRFGGDNHALWIDPDDSNHMLLGHDHGMGVTYDGGQTWLRPDNMPLAQFYAIGYDMEYPYNVYGGTQDNGSWKGPSTTLGRGSISYEQWSRVGGGDGMYNVVDWSDSRWLYNESQFGPIRRVDQVTGEARSIRYSAEGLRWNWNSPILVSPHDGDVVYHGANKLLRSSWRGETWEEISDDLTTNDEAKIVGTGNIQYCTITTIDESPIMPGMLWVGTDDGNVWVTGDGGDNWELLNDNIPNNPGWWVSRVVASSHDTSTAYVTFTGFRRDDFSPYVYKTTDRGATWTSIASNLPDEAINVIREDPINPNLLFVGTDKAVYASIDGGRSWSRMRGDMPAVAVHDLHIHPRENDLIVGTHGRGFFIADITPLQELTPEVLGMHAHLFRIETAYRWQDYSPNAAGSLNFAGESAPTGVVINYFLSGDAEEVKVLIYQGSRMIRELEGETEAGLNQIEWDMNGMRPRTPQERRQGQRRGGGGGAGGFAGGQAGQQRGDPNMIAVPVKPGEFRVVLSVDGFEYEGLARIEPDHWFPRK